MVRIEDLAEVTGKVYKIQIMEGVRMHENDSIMTIESMKMEIPDFSTDARQLIEILVDEGRSVEDGQVVAAVMV